MKSVEVINKFHRRVKFTHNKGCVYENNVQKTWEIISLSIMGVHIASLLP
jgi:hypothetical protein